jgi:hypothetical protein
MDTYWLQAWGFTSRLTRSSSFSLPSFSQLKKISLQILSSGRISEFLLLLNKLKAVLCYEYKEIMIYIDMLNPSLYRIILLDISRHFIDAGRHILHTVWNIVWEKLECICSVFWFHLRILNMRTYLRPSSCRFLQKLIVKQLTKKFTASYGTRRPIEEPITDPCPGLVQSAHLKIALNSMFISVKLHLPLTF